MSIFRYEFMRGHNPLSTLPQKIDYVLDPYKTASQYSIAIRGNYYSKDYPAMEAAIFNNKYLHGNLYGKGYDHYIISPYDAADEGLSAETMWAAAKEIGQLLCNQFTEWDQFLGIFALHFNTGLPHVHYLIDNVGLRTGRRRNFSRWEFQQLRYAINQCLQKYEISPIPVGGIYKSDYCPNAVSVH